MAVVYKQVELKDGQPLQFLGVYSLRWLREWGEPTVGFLEVDYRLDDALDDLASVQLIDNTGSEADAVRKEIEEILRKLTGDIQAQTEDAPTSYTSRCAGAGGGKKGELL